VAACPFSAIEMSHEFELATRDHGDLVRVLLRDVDAAGPKRTPREDAAAVAPAGEPAAAPEPATAPEPEPEPGDAPETGTEAADA
jgi:formate hydrogenlyase subunit 6/NADH:ubiquinone oxidoreductase subunit I